MKRNLKKKIKELNMLFDYIQKKIEEKDFSIPIPEMQLSDASTIVTETDNKKIKFDNKEFISSFYQGVGDLKNDIVDCVEQIQQLKYEILNQLRSKNSLIENLQAKIKRMKSEMTDLKDELIDLKGKIRIFCRIKGNEHRSDKISVDLDDNIINCSRKGRYMFDKIFDSSCTQDTLFSELLQYIDSAKNGYNVCFLAYGQTGSGKTYTMLGDQLNPGLLPRTLKYLFEGEEKFNISGQFFEIYNEKIKNLLTGNQIDIKIHSKNTFLTNIDWSPINNFSEIEEIYSTISDKRTTGKTRCNEQSSRSHMFSVIKVEREMDGRLISGNLVFVDLAGSERLKTSQAEGARLEETRRINYSLSNLRCVIDSIYRGDSHVPYRDSRLTMVLKIYFTNRSRVILMTNVSMEERNMEETLCTLRFSQVAGKCSFGRVENNFS